jgi:2-deoxy-D-gluconate 3-dehydrogenase
MRKWHSAWLLRQQDRVNGQAVYSYTHPAMSFSGTSFLASRLIEPIQRSNAVYPHMKQIGGGKIINIGSMTPYFGASCPTPYATSKGGIVQLSWAKPEHIVGTAIWLASPASGYVTGAAIPVDGGFSSSLF